MSSLFGAGCPIWKGVTLNPSTEISLLNTKFTDVQFQQPDLLEQVSVINGVRTFEKRVSDDTCNYSEFTMQVNLNKYADPSVSFQTLYSYLNLWVYFSPFSSPATKYIKDKDGSLVKFFVYSIIPAFLDDSGDYDILIINLKSEKYTSMAETIS